ncbi:formin-F [Drosophila eugracilis]|uniref:formin-F n=1 Tax=Drosophila eugracilis TaxID=29029 RepID=UPI0007E65508|nr:formin-F [Drosophila eugracilis]
MRRLLFLALISSTILSIQSEENLSTNTSKDVSRFQRSCTAKQCSDEDFQKLLDSFMTPAATTKAPPQAPPPPPPPPKNEVNLFKDIFSLIGKTKKALFGFG